MTLHLCVDSASRLSSHLNRKYLEGWKCRISACNLSLCPVAFLSQLLTGWFLPLSPSRQGAELIPLEHNWLLGAPQHPCCPHHSSAADGFGLGGSGYSGCIPRDSDSAQSSWLSLRPLRSLTCSGASGVSAEVTVHSAMDASVRSDFITTPVLTWCQFCLKIHWEKWDKIFF